MEVHTDSKKKNIKIINSDEFVSFHLFSVNRVHPVHYCSADPTARDGLRLVRLIFFFKKIKNKNQTEKKYNKKILCETPGVLLLLLSVAYFQPGSPIYSSDYVRFRLGHLDNNNSQEKDNYVWTYTSQSLQWLRCVCL